MSAVPRPKVNYVVAARRHDTDARTLQALGRTANAGQLFGLAMECGLKALLIAAGVTPDLDGSVPNRHKFRKHMPELAKLVDMDNIHDDLISEGLLFTRYLAMIPGRADFNNWSVDQRYWHDAALPLADLPAWAAAAAEMGRMLDQAMQDGVL